MIGLNESLHLGAYSLCSGNASCFYCYHPMLLMRTIRHRGVKGCALGHTAQVAGPQVSWLSLLLFPLHHIGLDVPPWKLSPPHTLCAKLLLKKSRLPARQEEGEGGLMTSSNFRVSQPHVHWPLAWSLRTAPFGWWGPALTSSKFPLWDMRVGAGCFRDSRTLWNPFSSPLLLPIWDSLKLA